MGRTGRIFYGWVIVGCGVLITALTAGMIINTNNLFVVPICEELGFSRAQMSFAQTLFSVAAMLVSLFAGPIFAENTGKYTRSFGLSEQKVSLRSMAS